MEGGRRRSVDDIPVAHTPPGGWIGAFPPPVLAGCADDVVAGAPDLRGMWQVIEVLVDGSAVSDHPALGHLQRVEQGADRIVITAGGIIHDMRCDGTVERGVHDVAEFDKQTPITVVASYEDEVHVLRPVGFPIEVRRRRRGAEMIWDYLGFTARLRRLGPPEGDPPEGDPPEGDPPDTDPPDTDPPDTDPPDTDPPEPGASGGGAQMV